MVSLYTYALIVEVDIALSGCHLNEILTHIMIIILISSCWLLTVPWFSLMIRRYYLSFQEDLLSFIQGLYKANACKSLLGGKHKHAHV